MINLMQKQEIILSHFREVESQWEIHRQTGIARKTIKKYIKEHEQKKQNLLNSDQKSNKIIEDIVSPPKYNTSNRAKRKLTEKIIEKINFFLNENEIKKATGRSKQQKKKIDIYECLIEEGYDISCSTVSKYIQFSVDKESVNKSVL